MGRGEGGGPKTEAGKAASRGNAIRHGLTVRLSLPAGKSPVLPWVESEEEWLEFEAAIVADLEPVGAVQEEKARTIAEWMWVRRRVRVYEKACVEGEQAGFGRHLAVVRMMDGTEKREDITPYHDEKYRKMGNRWLGRSVLPDERDLAKVIKYEAHLTRLINRELWELRLLKRDREGQGPGKTWVEVRHGYDELHEEGRGPRERG